MITRFVFKVQAVIVDALNRLVRSITAGSRALVKLVRKAQDLVRAGL